MAIPPEVMVVINFSPNVNSVLFQVSTIPFALAAAIPKDEKAFAIATILVAASGP
jgi:hypothetical protein